MPLRAAVIERQYNGARGFGEGPWFLTTAALSEGLPYGMKKWPEKMV
jgi:hypothetical protein